MEPSVPATDSEIVAGSRRSSRWRVGTLLVLLLAVAGFAAYSQRDRLAWPDFGFLARLREAVPGGATASSTVRVTPGQSIGAAIDRASAGTEVVVEPGEYREQVRLKSGVRVSSLVPRGASLRLPSGASEADSAVVAFEVSGGVFSGFRVVGDAATPLGAGVVVRNSDVALSDIEITGASTAAIEYVGSGGGSVVGADLHDNPGVAIVVRSGASPRITHNAFVRNATSERAAGTLLVEADARPVLTRNTFYGVRPESLITPPGFGRGALVRENWFIDTIGERPAAPVSRSGRGRR